MKLPIAPDTWFNKRIKDQNGIFDRQSFEMMMSAVSNHRTAIDIGAHVGTWSIGMSKSFHEVYAFEATPSNYQYLLQNTQEIKNIHTFNMAIGDNNISHVSTEKSHGTNSGEYHVSKIAHDVTVPMITIDQLCLHNVDLIKIDVEGYEMFVLIGAEKTIMENKPVILVELNATHAAYFGQTIEGIQEWIESHGYKLFSQCNKDFVYIPNI